MKAAPIQPIILALISLSLPACHAHKEEHSHEEHHKIVVTNPKAKDVIITQQYVCQIHSKRHIDVCALANGYLMNIPIQEGQLVRKGDLMFKILPTLYQAKLDAELAEVQLAQQELNNTNRLLKDKVVSQNEMALFEAKLAKAKARAKLAEAELSFTKVEAKFDGIVDRLHKQQGSVINEKEILTTLSDNSSMWVYFNVPEVRYLEYMAGLNQDFPLIGASAMGLLGSPTGQKHFLAAAGLIPGKSLRQEKDVRQIELVLADGTKFPHFGRNLRVEAKFNNETGNIPFRADFPNPNRLLRHGQTGNVLIRRVLKKAIVIPQRATFENLDKRYVYVVGKDHVVRQREIVILHEMDDLFVVKSGIGVDDRIVFEGIRQVRDGEKVEYELRDPELVMANQKYRAE